MFVVEVEEAGRGVGYLKCLEKVIKKGKIMLDSIHGMFSLCIFNSNILTFSSTMKLKLQRHKYKIEVFQLLRRNLRDLIPN
jgi:hypothetical protein